MKDFVEVAVIEISDDSDYPSAIIFGESITPKFCDVAVIDMRIDALAAQADEELAVISAGNKDFGHAKGWWVDDSAGGPIYFVGYTSAPSPHNNSTTIRIEEKNKPNVTRERLETILQGYGVPPEKLKWVMPKLRFV